MPLCSLPSLPLSIAEGSFLISQPCLAALQVLRLHATEHLTELCPDLLCCSVVPSLCHSTWTGGISAVLNATCIRSLTVLWG